MFKKPLTAWTHQIRQAGLLLTACACGVLPARQSAAQYPNPIYRPVQAGPMNAVPAAPQQPPAVPTAERIRELASWYPLCIIVGENPASQFVSTETVDEGPFQDYIMGARVQGTQKTNSRTSIDFVSNGNALRMQFVLKGITVSNTLAQTSQASIQSAGSVDFQVSKQIEFDGQLIKTWSPAAFMTIRQQNLGASTAMSQIPLLGPLANNIVMSAAEQRKPMSEMIAAQRITQAVAPVFNSRLDGELTRLNSQLSGDLRQKLTTANLYPSHIATVSSDEAGLYGAAFETSIPQASQPGAFHPISNSQRRLRARPVRQLLPAPELPGRAGQTGINAPVPFALEAASIRDRIICLMHESLIGDVALRFNLPGREVPLETLQRFLGKPANADSDSTGSLGKLILAERSPISARMESGELLITIRAGFRPVVGPEIPAQAVTVSLQPEFEGELIRLTPELRSIAPADPDGEKLGETAETILKGMLTQKLQASTFPRTFDLPRTEGQAPIRMRVQGVTLAQQWLTLSLEPVRTDGGAASAQPKNDWKPTRTTQRTAEDLQPTLAPVSQAPAADNAVPQ